MRLSRARVVHVAVAGHVLAVVLAVVAEYGRTAVVGRAGTVADHIGLRG